MKTSFFPVVKDTQEMTKVAIGSLTLKCCQSPALSLKEEKRSAVAVVAKDHWL